MIFTNLIYNGKAIIPPTALRLSELDHEERLDMHVLDRAVVLLKEDMPHDETIEVAMGLLHLADRMVSDLFSTDVETEDENQPDEDDMVGIPSEAFEDAGILGDNLYIKSMDGAVLITACPDTELVTERLMDTLWGSCFDVVAVSEALKNLRNSGNPNER